MSATPGEQHPPTTEPGPPTGAPGDVIPLREATKAWFAISLQTFGGPAGQIAVMQRSLVDENRWIGQQRFLFALSYCTLLPGPEAQQLATYVGWLLNGIKGALIAGILFVLPGVVALLALSGIYVAFGDTTLVEALFLGLAPAVIAIVIAAVIRVGRKGLGHPALVALAVASFIALTFFAVPFPVVVGCAALIGWLLGRAIPSLTASKKPAADDGPPPLISDDALHTERPSGHRAAIILATGLILWFAPVAIAAAAFGRSSIFVDQGVFFSGAAIVTFGGAYAVLAYVAQQAVNVYGWLAPGEMVRGLALAETTPGPLIMVVQFVAFVGAYRDPGSLNPWVGLFGPLLALSSISGPVLAGALLQVAPFGLGWRAVFTVNGILGVALVVLSLRVLPNDDLDRSVAIAPVPSALTVLGLLALLGGIVEGGNSGWRTLPVALVVAGLLLLGLFAMTQRRAADPLLDPALFKKVSFVAGVTTGSLFFAAVSGVLYVTSLFLQDGKGLSPFITAAIMSPLSLGIIATSFGLRSRVQQLGRRLVATGIALTFLGVVAELILARSIADRPALLAMPLLIAGLGMGCCFGSFFATALGEIDADQAGSASGTLNALQQVANSAGAALVSTVFLAVLRNAHPAVALTASLAAVIVVLAVCAASVPLLPRHPAADHH